MTHALTLSYVFTLLCLLLGAPYLLYQVARRARGAAGPIVQGVAWGISLEAFFMLSLSLLLAVFFGNLSLGFVGLPLGASLLGAGWGFAVEGVRALALARFATRIRETRLAVHFGLGWGCGMAAMKGALLLASLSAVLYGDTTQALSTVPEAERAALSAGLEQFKNDLLEAPVLRPPLEHVLGYGLDAFYHVVFALIVIRIWTRGQRGAWIVAGVLHGALNMGGALLHALGPGWVELLAVLAFEGALAFPAYRWAAHEIVRPGR
jgi:hypothetical protein